jgi:hypothetical protein
MNQQAGAVLAVFFSMTSYGAPTVSNLRGLVIVPPDIGFPLMQNTSPGITFYVITQSDDWKTLQPLSFALLTPTILYPVVSWVSYDPPTSCSPSSPSCPVAVATYAGFGGAALQQVQMNGTVFAAFKAYLDTQGYMLLALLPT